MKLRDNRIHGAVWKASGMLKPLDKVAYFLPWDLIGVFEKVGQKIIKIRANVGSKIRSNGMVCKTAKGDHLPKGT